MDEQLRTLTLPQSAINVIADALNEKIRFWHEHNEVLTMHGADESINRYVEKNNQHICCLKTLLDYITSIK